MPDSNGRDRHRVDIYLCEGCHDPFDEGDNIVSLSNGRAIGGEYHVTNRRLFHTDCWKKSAYMDADNQQKASR